MASHLGVGALLLLVAALPFLTGVKNLIGLLIIGFGLWEAWKLNKRTDLSISGPYQVGAAAAGGLPRLMICSQCGTEVAGTRLSCPVCDGR